MKVQSSGSRRAPKGADLHVVDGEPVAVFAAYVVGQTMQPGGEMKLHLGVPFAQVPHVMPVMQFVGGITFEVTVRRVAAEDLPGPGW